LSCSRCLNPAAGDCEGWSKECKRTSEAGEYDSSSHTLYGKKEGNIMIIFAKGVQSCRKAGFGIEILYVISNAPEQG